MVALIDKPILQEHEEWGGRLHYHEVFEGDMGLGYHFHGAACTTFLAGETAGVAPGATIEYFAIPDQGRNAYYYVKALRRIVEFNEATEEGARIRVVSISDGVGAKDPDHDAFKEAVRLANQAGIAVVYSGSPVLDGVSWGGCPPHEDRSDPSNYSITPWLRNKGIPSSRLIAPGDFRTSAANLATTSYTYWGAGGYSWAIPYVAGLLALGWQVVPEAGVNELILVLQSSSGTSADGFQMVRPVAYIETLQK